MVDESLLDDPERLEAADPAGTMRALAGAGANVRRSRVLALEAGVERLSGDRPRGLLVAAVGSTSTVGDVLDLLAEPGSPIFCATGSNLPLPGWVGPLDLVIAASTSGRAPGPLGLAAEAGRRGARLLCIGAADSPLAQVCAQYRGVHVDPGHLAGGTSRGSLWSILTPALLGAAAMGVIPAVDDILDTVADTLDSAAEEYRPSSETFVNPAKTLAQDLAEVVPVILGDGPVTGVVAARAANVLARTARTPATCGVLPDAASQIVATFDGPFAGQAGQASPTGAEDIFADPFLDGPPRPRLGLLMLREPLPDPVTDAHAARHNLAQAVVDSARQAGVRVWEHETAAGEPLVRLAGQVALVDFAATYLALGLGFDPAGSDHVRALRDQTR